MCHVILLSMVVMCCRQWRDIFLWHQSRLLLGNDGTVGRREKVILGDRGTPNIAP